MMKIGRLSANQLSRWKNAGAVLLVGAVTAIASPAQTFTSLADFDQTTGYTPTFLVQGFDGSFYGTAYSGGANHRGTFFRLTRAGTVTTLYSFCSQSNCADGAFPLTLMQGADGNFYGTTYGDNSSGATAGTIFKVTPTGALTTLHNLAQGDGRWPYGTLVQGLDGNFYGTAYGAGANKFAGTVFKITPAGAFTTLYNFCQRTRCTDGFDPLAGLVQGSDGNFYGTTGYGGAYGYGTVFRITPAGTLTTVHSFNGTTDGASPTTPLVQGTDGSFYGVAGHGGGTSCTNGCGTIFKITPQGSLTTLHSFGSTDGSLPNSLALGTDGDFYGTTAFGGAYKFGTVFQITPTGSLTTLYSVCAQTNCPDGNQPQGLIQATNGIFYGTTRSGGSSAGGTAFSLATGLGPFVETNPTIGKVGWKINIFGDNLIGTTAVSFDGAAAAFTVVSGTKITATVPSGATTGTVTVTTPSGILTSNASFVVKP